jgi:hypothetical protein
LQHFGASFLGMDAHAMRPYGGWLKYLLKGTPFCISIVSEGSGLCRKQRGLSALLHDLLSSFTGSHRKKLKRIKSA